MCKCKASNSFDTFVYEDIWELVCDKQEIMTWMSNYIPQNTADVIPEAQVSVSYLPPVYQPERCSPEGQPDAK